MIKVGHKVGTFFFNLKSVGLLQEPVKTPSKKSYSHIWKAVCLERGSYSLGRDLSQPFSNFWAELKKRERSISTEIPLGTTIHNVELTPGKGGQLVRAAGTVAKLVAKEGQLATIRLPSSEIRLIPQSCLASIGRVGNIDISNEGSGKAGSRRWLGKRPKVRGSAMNPVDHPHGGGEGRTSVGRKKPATPWGSIAFGRRSRKKRKYSNPFILRRRKVQ